MTIERRSDRLRPILEARYTQVSGGDGYACGLKTDGTIACWGGNYYGRVHAAYGHLLLVSAGYNFTCGVKTDGLGCLLGRPTERRWPSHAACGHLLLR